MWIYKAHNVSKQAESEVISETSLSSQSLGYGTDKKPRTTKINTRNPKIYTRNPKN